MDEFTGCFEQCGFSSLAGLSERERVLHCPIACVDEKGRGARPPGQNWVHYLVKLQQILTVMRLPSNLRANWSRNEQNETSRTPRTGMYVSNLGGLSLSDESFPNGGARGAFAKPSRGLREAFAEPPRRHHEPFAEVYGPFAEVAHTEGSTKTPWRVHEASSKGSWMNCMFLLDHDCNRVWPILYCF